MGNQHGEYGIELVQVQRDEEFQAYDSLPKNIRAIIAQAPYNIAASKLQDCFLNETTLVSAIKQGTRKNALAAYGPDHPQAQDQEIQ